MKRVMIFLFKIIMTPIVIIMTIKKILRLRSMTKEIDTILDKSHEILSEKIASGIPEEIVCKAIENVSTDLENMLEDNLNKNIFEVPMTTDSFIRKVMFEIKKIYEETLRFFIYLFYSKNKV